MVSLTEDVVNGQNTRPRLVDERSWSVPGPHRSRRTSFS